MNVRHHQNQNESRTRRIFGGIAAIVVIVLIWHGAVTLGGMIEAAKTRAHSAHVA